MRMRSERRLAWLAWTAVIVAALTVASFAASSPDRIPKFEPDPWWPKALPNGWITGNIAGVHVDGKDQIWVMNRANTRDADMGDDYAAKGFGECCRPAPPVLVFDMAGNLVKSWGPKTFKPIQVSQMGAIYDTGEGYDWPREHGIFVDHKGNVWTGADLGGYTLTKFTNDGKLIWQKGTGARASKGNMDPEVYSGTSGIFVDAAANEAFISDGYGNKRVIVVDADTGAVKRIWGPYGVTPPPEVPREKAPGGGKDLYDPKAPPSKLWGDTLHCIELSNDGLVYICDRSYNRIQVYRKDGTFVKEGWVRKETKNLGSTFDVAFSPDKAQKWMYVADGSNHQVHILVRDTLEHVGSFSNGGRGPGELGLAHVIATDSKGNVYVGETINRNRIQRWKYMGLTKRTRS